MTFTDSGGVRIRREYTGLRLRDFLSWEYKVNADALGSDATITVVTGDGSPGTILYRGTITSDKTLLAWAQDGVPLAAPCFCPGLSGDSKNYVMNVSSVVIR